MRIKIALYCLCAFVLYGCSTTSKTVQTKSKEAIYQVLKDQEAAWNRGDLEGFMDGYWASDSLVFIGSRGITKGWKTTLDNYKKGYPSKEAMGTLMFDIIRTEYLSPTCYHMIGRYTLFRKEDQPTGVFTLVWKKIDGHWKIVLDQTCG